MKAPSNNRINYTPRGVSTLEILIAFAIITLTLTAGITLIFGNQAAGTDSQTGIEALSKAQALLEQERALARQDFSSVQSVPQTQDDIYKKQVTVSYPNPLDTDTKLVTTTVTWTSGLRPLSVKLSTIVTNNLSGSFCSPTLSSPTDWKNPTAYEFQTPDLVQESPLGSRANGLGLASLYVYRGKMYLVANQTPGSDTHTLYIYSLPSNPGIIPSFLGWANTTGNQLADVTVAIKNSSIYAYIVSSKQFNFSPACTNITCPQFQVVDVTNAMSPVWKTGLYLPVTYTSGQQGVGSTVTYNNGYVFVGLVKGAGATDKEFQIIDVGGGSGSPTSPVLKGGYHIGNTVKSITVSGNYAYVATTDTTSQGAGGNKQVMVFDVSDKSNPTLIRSFNAPDSFGVGNALAISSGKLYFGKAYSSTYPNFYIFDASNPAASLPTLGSKVLSFPASLHDSVNSVAIRDHYAFAITNSQFQIWDVNNPANLSPWTTDGTTNSFLSFSSIDSKINGSSGSTCSGDLLYGAFQTSQGNSKDVVVIFGPHVASSYSLSNSGDISLTQGNQGTVNVTAAVTSGYPSSATFVASGLPAGVGTVLNPGSCTPGCSSNVTVTTSATTPVGVYPITITGTGGVTTTFNLTVTAAPIFDYSLSAPASVHIVRGTPQNLVVTLTKLSGTAVPVAVTLTSLPSNASISSVSPASSSCTPNTTCTVTFTLTANSSASKSSTGTIKGASPTHSTAINMSTN